MSEIVLGLIRASTPERAHASPCSSQTDDPMVLRLWQGELRPVPDLLLCHDVSTASNTLKCMPTSCRVAFLSRLGARTHLGVYLLTRPSRRLSTKTSRHQEGFSLKGGTVARYNLTSVYRS